MDNIRIWKFIWIIAFPISTVFAFTILGLMKFLCQTLKIHLRKPYVLVELRFRLWTSIGESILMALTINVGGIMAQDILAPPVIWRQWLWSTIMTWILWGIGTFTGKSIAVWVFGKNICNNVAG